MYARAQVHMQTCTHAHAYSSYVHRRYGHMYTCTKYTSTHKQVLTYTYAHAHMRTHSHTCAHMRTHVHTCAHPLFCSGNPLRTAPTDIFGPDPWPCQSGHTNADMYTNIHRYTPQGRASALPGRCIVSNTHTMENQWMVLPGLRLGKMSAKRARRYSSGEL